MRPSPGKEEGLVLDNAGLWLEHGFCQQDRIRTLKGKKKRKRRESLEQYLSENNQNLNLIHLKYIQNRISRLPGAPNQGTWYHIKKKVITIGSSEGLDRMFIIKKVKVSGAEYCGF